jgi:hypothetical protein
LATTSRTTARAALDPQITPRPTIRVSKRQGGVPGLDKWRIGLSGEREAATRSDPPRDLPFPAAHLRSGEVILNDGCP